MKTLDHNYLRLQFRERVHSKKGADYQTFFENIMEKAFLDYQKIRPYGNKGDGGNDGFIRGLGIYYQVYAPSNSTINESKAAKKCSNDFHKLIQKWNHIEPIKEYNFVFNDDFHGSSIPIEESLAALQIENPAIKFRLFLTRSLEEIFFNLPEKEILSLGFSIDSTQALKNCYEYLGYAKKFIDKENVYLANEHLESVKNLVFTFDDEILHLEYELLECKCLQLFEKVDEAKIKYEQLSRRYPKDSRPLLFLANIYLNNGEFDKNEYYLNQAETISPNDWLYKLFKLNRKLFLTQEFEQWDEIVDSLPDDQVIKSHFYCIYSIYYENHGDQKLADSFIEKAIRNNPEKYQFHETRIVLLGNRLHLLNDEQRKKDVDCILNEIKKLENKFFKKSEISIRRKAFLFQLKINALCQKEDFLNCEIAAEVLFNLILNCYFDKQIDSLLVICLQFYFLIPDKFKLLLRYFDNSKNRGSDNLAELIILFFDMQNNLFSEGKSFYKYFNNNYYQFIQDFENEDSERIINFIRNKLYLIVRIPNSLRQFPEIRNQLIQILPTGIEGLKIKLSLFISNDNSEINEAFRIIQQINLSELNYYQCRSILEIIKQKQAWEFEITVLIRIIDKEQNEKSLLNYYLDLIGAYKQLHMHSKVEETGKYLLHKNETNSYLSPKNKEAILAYTLEACIEIGKVEEGFNSKALFYLEKYPLETPSYEFKIGYETEVYLANADIQKAYEAVVQGVRIKKHMPSLDYANLHLFLILKFKGQLKIDLSSKKQIVEETFIKFYDQDKWYFLCQNNSKDNSLDALPISPTNSKYSTLLGKNLGDKVVFANKYGNSSKEYEIEYIFSCDQYIFWQTIVNFKKYSQDGDLEGVQQIEVLNKNGELDFEYLIKLFKEIDEKSKPIFELYCQNKVPLAILALSEGGLIQAIGKIQQNQKGFINFCDGSPKEFSAQKRIAKQVLDDKSEFYIDCTSALIFAETGLYKKFHDFLPNLKIPQSVISHLIEIYENQFAENGYIGHIGFSNGNLVYSPRGSSDFIQKNFSEALNLFNKNQIGIISSANKLDCISEKSLPAELCDAFLLGQKENIPILTEDYFLTAINAFETGKTSPSYFSIFAFIQVLYEEHYIDFKDFLDYFSFFSSYRFRFLNINSEIIEKTIFGDKGIKTPKPDNIRKLNFKLTLSEEYGVPPQLTLRIIYEFLTMVLNDDSITVELIEQIFMEIIESLPTKINKEIAGMNLLREFYKNFSERPKIIASTVDVIIVRKLKRMLQVLSIYNPQFKILTL